MKHPDRVRVAGRDKRFIAVKCGVANCSEQFPLLKRGDLGSYSLGAYDRHLREAHQLFLPKPVPVESWMEKNKI